VKTSGALVVRPVTEADVPRVVELVRVVLAEFGLVFGVGAHTDDELTRLPASYETRGGAFWIALQDDQLIGTGGVFPVAPETFEVRKMYLLPAARGLGAGKRLLEECITFARARGGKRLVLDTIEQMTRAIAFYERYGFVRDDSQIRGSRCSRGYVREL
jgi:putative acetyltransferase